ncbi:MAG TPA: oligosaccharide flippase family protein [Candidatus Rifleibacterium sp.]|nr:oligosaccharide flippase family protein [Candidatus Rifleibacterium sp.]HPT44696.1 oligosaccharide flippase family protein [Candidatus Rifleibacterium sp.]
MREKILANVGRLLCGSSISALMTFAAAALTARTIGTSNFGILVFIQAFALIIAQLPGFNTWQAIITFGSRARQQNDNAALCQIIKISLLLDLVSGLLAFAAAMILAGPLTRLLGWPSETATLLQFYAPAAILSGSTTAAGILRLHNRFSLLAAAGTVTPLLRLTGALLGFAGSYDLAGFTRAYLVATLSGQTILLLAAAATLGRPLLTTMLFQPLQGLTARFNGFWRYLLISNLHATVKLLTRESDQLITAAFINPAGLGVLKIARQFAMLLPMLADPIYQTLFTEFSRLHAGQKDSESASLMKQSAIAGLLIGVAALIIFLIAGPSVISMVFGDEFMGAVPVTIIFMVAFTIALAGLHLQPVMLARGQPEASFKINLISTIIYLILLPALTSSFGIKGAAGAYVFYYLAWTVMMQAKVRKSTGAHER